jgi:hypothetical protein
MFPPPTVSVPGFLLFEGLFPADDIFYPAYVGDINLSIHPNLLVDPDAIYPFTTTRSIAIVPSLFTDIDVIYAPVVNNKVLAPQLFIDVELFGGLKKLQQGQATINQQFPIDRVIDVDNVYGAVIGFAGITLITQQALLAGSDDVVYLNETTSRDTVLQFGSFVHETAAYTAPPSGALLAHLVVDTDTIPIPNLLGSLGPPLFQDIDAFYGPARLYTLQPGAVLDSDVVFAPRVGRQLLPDVVSDQDTFNGPTFTLPGSFALFVDPAESIPAPTVTPQRATILPPLLNDVDAFTTARLDAAIIAPILPDDTIFRVPVTSIGPLTPVVSVIDPEPFFAPVIGDAPHVPSLVLDTDVFLAPSIGITRVLTVGIVTDSDGFYAPAAAQSGFDGTLVLDGPIMPSTPQPTVIFIEG